LTKKKLIKKKYKSDCNFRKKIRCCNFPVEKCHSKQIGDSWGDYCHLYDLEWDYKKLRSQAKQMTKDMKELDKGMKKLKDTDKEAYKEYKRRIKDLFNGIVICGKAMMFIKRSGRGVSKHQQVLADKLMEKLKNDDSDL